jgi:hypothetical protein
VRRRSSERTSSVAHPRMVLRVRAMATSDFEFVRELSSRTAGYTVPTPYLLWMFCQFQSDFCAVVESHRGERLGYFLSMPASGGPGALFVWQFACILRGRRLKAADILAKQLKSVARRKGLGKLIFTTVPDTAQERSIRFLARRVFRISPVCGRRVPRQASSTEFEYVLTIADGESSKAGRKKLP